MVQPVCVNKENQRQLESPARPKIASFGKQNFGLTSLKETPQSPIRLLVLGSHGVGKSALIVRYLTKRFIGEYKSQVDIVYRQTLSIECEQTNVEIIDISTHPGNETVPTLEINQSHCFIVVYSISDRSSFQAANQLLNAIHKLCPDNPKPAITLIGNKVDLEHSRQVSFEEGMESSRNVCAEFAEVSVTEMYENIGPIFLNLIRRAINVRRAFLAEGGAFLETRVTLDSSTALLTNQPPASRKSVSLPKVPMIRVNSKDSSSCGSESDSCRSESGLCWSGKKRKAVCGDRVQNVNSTRLQASSSQNSTGIGNCLFSQGDGIDRVRSLEVLPVGSLNSLLKGDADPYRRKRIASSSKLRKLPEKPIYTASNTSALKCPSSENNGVLSGQHKSEEQKIKLSKRATYQSRPESESSNSVAYNFDQNILSGKNYKGSYPSVIEQTTSRQPSNTGKYPPRESKHDRSVSRNKPAAKVQSNMTPCFDFTAAFIRPNSALSSSMGLFGSKSNILRSCSFNKSQNVRSEKGKRDLLQNQPGHSHNGPKLDRTNASLTSGDKQSLRKRLIFRTLSCRSRCSPKDEDEGRYKAGVKFALEGNEVKIKNDYNILNTRLHRAGSLSASQHSSETSPNLPCMLFRGRSFIAEGSLITHLPTDDLHKSNQKSKSAGQAPMPFQTSSGRLEVISVSGQPFAFKLASGLQSSRASLRENKEDCPEKLKKSQVYLPDYLKATERNDSLYHLPSKDSYMTSQPPLVRSASTSLDLRVDSKKPERKATEKMQSEQTRPHNDLEASKGNGRSRGVSSKDTKNLHTLDRDTLEPGAVSDKSQSTSPVEGSRERKFSVFGMGRTLSNFFSRGSLPELSRATANLYDKFGSFKKSIKKSSV